VPPVSSSVLPAAAAPDPGSAAEGVAAVVTAVWCVLLGAPLGLAWAALTPRLETRIVDGQVSLGETQTLIAADGWFVAVGVAAGLLTGLLVALLGRRHGLGCAVGLLLGGLLGAEVMRRTGALVGAAELRTLLVVGDDGAALLPVRLRSVQALAAWPLAALLVHMVTAVLSGPPQPRPRAARVPSSG
jgi:hypothetical protein